MESRTTVAKVRIHVSNQTFRLNPPSPLYLRILFVESKGRKEKSNSDEYGRRVSMHCVDYFVGPPSGASVEF